MVEHFGDFTAHSVDIGTTHIADSAHRWAVLADAGPLELVDTEYLTHAAYQRGGTLAGFAEQIAA